MNAAVPFTRCGELFCSIPMTSSSVTSTFRVFSSRMCVPC